ncbi:MAG: MFS transporter, partial [Acidobacteriaceae bacterium]|nr:MFS transporter [Acidobacteriaceae bacterium]
KHGALGYGLLNASIGAGAVIGAVSLPRVRARLSSDQIIAAASVVFVLTLLVMAFIHQTALVVAVLFLGGFAWTSTTSTFNIAVQTCAPAWVQARLLGAYQMTFQAGMAIGSAVWGAVAERWSTPAALTVAAAGLLAGLPLARRYRVITGNLADLSSAAALARSDPSVVVPLRPEDGPVLISIRYHIDPAQTQEFVSAIHELKSVRLRDGAMRWGLFHDASDPTRFVENFLVESWAEYLRQRKRLTVSDLAVRDKVHAFHQGEGNPRISRFIYTPTNNRNAV